MSVAFDGFEKAEVAEMTESLLKHWVTGRPHPLVKVLPNPPTKLTGASTGTTIVVSKKGNYKSASAFTVPKEWLIESIARGELVTDRLNQYSCLFQDFAFYVPEEAQGAEACARYLKQHNGTLVTSLDKPAGRRLLVVVPRPQTEGAFADHFNREVKACLVDKLKLTYD